MTPPNTNRTAPIHTDAPRTTLLARRKAILKMSDLIHRSKNKINGDARQQNDTEDTSCVYLVLVHSPSTSAVPNGFELSGRGIPDCYLFYYLTSYNYAFVFRRIPGPLQRMVRLLSWMAAPIGNYPISSVEISAQR